METNEVVENVTEVVDTVKDITPAVTEAVKKPSTLKLIGLGAGTIVGCTLLMEGTMIVAAKVYNYAEKKLAAHKAKKAAKSKKDKKVEHTSEIDPNEIDVHFETPEE